MDLLKREMERKKKALQEAKRKILMEQADTSAATTGSHPQRRYMKTSDLRRLMEETRRIG
jgi:hypothetical protein